MRKTAKILMLLLIMVVASVTMIAIAMADEQKLPEVTEPAIAGFTWLQLATVGGATTLTLIIVQYTKVKLDKFLKIPTRAWVYIIALTILVAAKFFTEGIQFDTFMQQAVNALIVATSAMGAYESTYAKRDRKIAEIETTR